MVAERTDLKCRSRQSINQPQQRLEKDKRARVDRSEMKEQNELIELQKLSRDKGEKCSAKSKPSGSSHLNENAFRSEPKGLVFLWIGS
jgi:hypothetical protein